ncbi:F-box/kelch-repeat protein SKIP20 [Euphorbia lathyris]|uniref:F-box/kelch-repeat protein SKIP20 n=1 Tax=Euphorbia lathyris TaxID=212925 RepID=UPI0033133725
MGQETSNLKNPQIMLQSNRGGQEEAQELIPGLPDEIAMECLVRVPYQFHSNMKSVCRSWRTSISNSYFYRERRKSGFAEDLVFLVQPLPQSDSTADHLETTAAITDKDEKQDDRGNQHQIHTPPQFAVSLYNATFDTWLRTNPQGGIPMFCQCLALPFSGKVLLLGGWDPATLEPVPNVHILDLNGGQRWRRGASMSVSRSFFACAVIGPSTIYVAGGHDGQKNALKSAEVYDVDRDEWRMLPDMEEERDECQGLVWEDDSKFWVVSGYGTDSQGQFRSDAECFDPITESWSKIEGIWPYSNTSPRGATVAVSVNKNQQQWWWFLAGEQQQQQQNQLGKVNSIPVPDCINGTNPCVINLGYSNDSNKNRLLVISGNCRRLPSSSGSGSSSCSECDSEGAFILERDCSNGSTKWNHIHSPSGFSGIPFSASYLQI